MNQVKLVNVTTAANSETTAPGRSAPVDPDDCFAKSVISTGCLERQAGGQLSIESAIMGLLSESEPETRKELEVRLRSSSDEIAVDALKFIGLLTELRKVAVQQTGPLAVLNQALDADTVISGLAALMSRHQEISEVMRALMNREPDAQVGRLVAMSLRETPYPEEQEFLRAEITLSAKMSLLTPIMRQRSSCLPYALDPKQPKTTKILESAILAPQAVHSADGEFEIALLRSLAATGSCRIRSILMRAVELGGFRSGAANKELVAQLKLCALSPGQVARLEEILFSPESTLADDYFRKESKSSGWLKASLKLLSEESYPMIHTRRLITALFFEGTIPGIAEAASAQIDRAARSYFRKNGWMDLHPAFAQTFASSPFERWTMGKVQQLWQAVTDSFSRRRNRMQP